MKNQILLIDDNQSIRNLIACLLQDSFDVICKTDGIEAMLWLGQGNLPDCIIADAAMPKMKGYDFIANLKSSGFFCDVPVIVLSDEDNNEITIDCIQAGAVDYILKPFTPAEILDKVNKTLVGVETV